MIREVLALRSDSLSAADFEGAALEAATGGDEMAAGGRGEGARGGAGTSLDGGALRAGVAVFDLACCWYSTADKDGAQCHVKGAVRFDQIATWP